MKRLFRSYPVPLWIVALMLVAVTIMATGWSSAYQQRIENRDFLLKRLAEQQATIEQVQEVSVGLMAANAIMLGAWQYEKMRADDNEQNVHRANGRLGPMQRKINDLEEDVERLRNNWTSELGVGR